MRPAAPEPPLTDGLITLRLWRDEDVPAIAAACNEKELARWLDQVPHPYSDEDGRFYVNLSREGWAEGTLANFAVADSETDEVLGAIGVRWVDWEQSVAEVGYWVKREARRRGVATRALKLVSRWALAEVGMLRLQLRTDVGNGPSQRVAEAAGFLREGVLRSARTHGRDGHRVDWAIFSLIPADLGSKPT